MKNYSEQEILAIEKSYDELIQLVGETMTLEEVGFIGKAYDLCCVKYDGMRMRSGRPMMLHVLEVAKICYSEMGMHSKTIVCALLHNITKVSDVTFDEIKEKFGERVALILNGLIKVMSLNMSQISTQSDTFRKLFLSMIDDIRVVMLIIAHCLSNCRNQGDIDASVDKFFEITKYLVIPIVHRLGLYNIKKDMEEAVMIHENPKEYNEIKEKITMSHVVQEEKMANFLLPIRRGLSEEGIDYTIKWRTKSIPSIFAKMKAQNVPFEQVYDLFAVRIIINNSKIKEEKADCWKVYSVVTNLYQPNPQRLRDWITKPKASGYESLHTTVKNGVDWVEVQIRTSRMDEIAEKGNASHWSYKSHNDKHQTPDEWLNQIRSILEDTDQLDFNPLDDKRAAKGKSDKMYIITPQGEVKQLPLGSTILDFAFEVHSQVGSHCIGARVNGKMQPIRYVLSNGDRVEIQINKRQTPKADWLNYVNTEKAKSKIRRFLKDEEMKEAELGSSIFHRKLKNWKITFNDKIFSDLLKNYDCSSGIELYHKIATNQIDMVDLKAFILSQTEDKEIHQDRVDEELKKDKPVENESDAMSIGSNINGFAFKMAKCCNPIPGDNVCGFVNVGGGITIHRVNCKNAIAMKKRYPYRLVDVKWQGDVPSRATIKVVAKDSFGVLSDITEVMKQMEINIIDASMGTRNGQYEGRFVVHVTSVNYLEQLIRKLRSLNNVIEVQRID
ncbi:MAG: bifunctional (p)ppGpp synthetase/guanosine-3',5'-bis(diphosphate) 3'-pyrophosphohydrolase [Bacteroidales bacterium]|nr:bifunctional (p)ppGpp synthetase/guanosine-3',5'-bis(diphosphate) 3'-pyrophosphohydrolase [Bacteroidales bacterium]